MKDGDIMKDKIWLASPHMSDEGYEMEYIKEAFDTNWIAPLGPNVTGFENEFAEKINAPCAAALNTGTAAVHMALKAVGVEAGDVVLCQSLTFSASANPIIYQGAVPVFIGSDRETWNMDPDALEAACRKYGDRVKAVMVVHLYGLPADMDKLLEIAGRYSVPVIEDAAESLGSYYKGRHTGTLGEYGIFSFNGNKIITTSGGGMLVSGSREKIEKVRFWSTQSRDQAKHYQHSELGFNYRMSNISAGIGRGQLKVLDARLAKKKYIFDFYEKELGDLAGVRFMPVNEWARPNFWLSCFTVENSVKPLDLLLKLEEENIESRPIWKPMHIQPFFKDFDYIGSEAAEAIYEKGLCLPSDTKMSDEDLHRVCDIVKRQWR
jgi:dTDP-4-amino-4,6-dideoxygalactose transaminase